MPSSGSNLAHKKSKLNPRCKDDAQFQRSQSVLSWKILEALLAPCLEQTSQLLEPQHPRVLHGLEKRKEK